MISMAAMRMLICIIMFHVWIISSVSQMLLLLRVPRSIDVRLRLVFPIRNHVTVLSWYLICSIEERTDIGM